MWTRRRSHIISSAEGTFELKLYRFVPLLPPVCASRQVAPALIAELQVHYDEEEIH